jgi:hypothetical protein
MIPANELAALQAVAAAALDTPCVIQRNTPIKDAHGSQADSWATIATVSCNLAQPTSGLMQNYGFLIGSEDSWLVRLPAGQDVRRNDQIIVGATGPTQRTLRVAAALTPQSYSSSTRVLASVVL